MPERSAAFESFHFMQADELLQAIAPAARLETETPSPSFVFRGHGDADWNLTPSALRRHASGWTRAIAMVGQFLGMGTADEQAWAEIHLLKLFIESCDREGISIPGDDYEFRKAWMDDQNGRLQRVYITPSTWPFDQHFPLLAFAQHHGIPTRLLDWSRNATVAAYFAAVDAINLKDGPGDLAVWALNLEFIHVYDRVKVIPMPGANSERLAAQKGLFTLTTTDARRSEPIDEASFMDALVSGNEDRAKPRPIWKLTLPRAEARRLLYLCHLNGIDAAAVYPGTEGAARAAIERAVWGSSDPETGFSAVTIRPVGAAKIKSQRL